MNRAVILKLAAGFQDLLFHFFASGPSHHELHMVPDQDHEPAREAKQYAHQIPTALFETFSLRTIVKSKVHWAPPGLQEEPAGLIGLDGS